MNWDRYFLGICDSVAKKSPCLSRHIGAILVRDNSIISTGYNGPPRGIPHCGSHRFHTDEELRKLMNGIDVSPVIDTLCPRKVLDYCSGTHMELCPAQHAEENAVSNAARNGVSILNTTCYLNTVIPCSKCFGTLINAGIVEIVCCDQSLYDNYTNFLITNSKIKIRQFREE